jgi:choline monooxygenase
MVTGPPASSFRTAPNGAAEVAGRRVTRSLPAAAYVAEDWRARERGAVFAPAWQLVAHASQLAAPGDHLEVDVAGVPLLVLVDDGGALRALHNVCRHRAGPLAVCPAAGGRAGHLRCRYHGWRYHLDGRLAAAPDMPAGPGFDPAAIRLPSARVEVWRGLVFVALDERAGALDALVGPLAPRLAGIDLEGFVFQASVGYEIACNWKGYVDNYLEGYHIPHIHPALNRMLDYRSYTTTTGPLHSIQHSPLENADGPWGRGEALYVFLWPNAMLNLLPDRLQVNRVLPLAPGRCRVEFDYLYPAGPAEQRARRFADDHALSDLVQHEDVAICEAVQRGMASGSWPDGPLNPLRETGVAHFHHLIQTAMRQSEPP